jgi:hypothetical protein
VEAFYPRVFDDAIHLLNLAIGPQTARIQLTTTYISAMCIQLKPHNPQFGRIISISILIGER